MILPCLLAFSQQFSISFPMETFLYTGIGLLLGAGLSWLIVNTKLTYKNEKLQDVENECNELKTENKSLREENSKQSTLVVELKTKLEDEIKSSQEKLKVLEQAEKKLSETFQALSAKALQSNNQSFLELAKENLEKFQNDAQNNLKNREKAIEELVKPLKESLQKVDHKIHDLEKQRVSAYSTLTEQVKFLTDTQNKLQSETQNLVKALRAPQVRGRWGEMTLRRVAELAGMVEYCDFIEQESKTLEDDKRLRPDMIVKLPMGRQIVVDAKTPLLAYLNTLESDNDEDYEKHLREHARQLQDHLKQLSQKSYWSQFNPSPEFVVMFVPGENFFSAALKQNPNLIEDGVKMGVILATPTTLISLLKSVSYGWRQEQLAKNAQEISLLAKDLYERITVLGNHFDHLGKALKRSVDYYNNAVGALESRVLPQARRFKDLGVHPKEDLKELEVIDNSPRSLQAPELESVKAVSENN